MYTLITSILDAARGGQFKWFPSALATVLYGMVIAYIVTPIEFWSWGWIVASFMLGESFGWGEPLGAALYKRQQDQDHLERWQVGYLKDHPWVSLMVRGAMWGLPMSVVGLFLEIDALVWSTLIFSIAMVLAPLLTMVSDKWNKWKLQEYLRGFIVGLLFYMVV